MTKKIFVIIIGLILGGILIVACGSKEGKSSTDTSATEIPIVPADINIVAEGRIVPRESVQLAFLTSGQIAKVFVEEGDQVKKGDVLASLSNRESYEAGVAAAQVELLAAQQAQEELNRNVEVARGQALQTLAEANRAVKEAQYQFDNFTIPSNQTSMTALDAVVAMREKLDQVRTAFEPYKYDSYLDSDRKKLKEDLDAAQSDYNAAVRRLEYETALKDAHAKLDRALEDFQELEAGPDPDAMAAAQARVNAAEATIASAEASLDNLELVATFDGTVAKQDLIEGQEVAAGQVVMIVADFSQMYVETDDLTEIEVVDVSVGQKVLVVPDALPDLELTGTVDTIGNVFEEKRGDITYTVKIKLDEMDARLRWGMTVVVTFEE